MNLAEEFYRQATGQLETMHRTQLPAVEQAAADTAYDDEDDIILDIPYHTLLNTEISQTINTKITVYAEME